MSQDLNTSINEHIQLMERLSVLDEEVAAAIQTIRQAFSNEKKLLVCGNGGSASDAQHFASEFTGRFEKDRKGFPAFSLTTDSSALTAMGNDYGFNQIFARQIESVGNAGDVLLVISTSGNSDNLRQAVEIAKSKNIRTLGLLGRDGGVLRNLVDKAIVVPGERTSRIQEAHIFLLHFICQAFE